jgi:hypothetical protein
LEAAGFRVVSIEDLTVEWGPILQQRLAMFQAMRQEAEAAGMPAGNDAFHQRFVPSPRHRGTTPIRGNFTFNLQVV